MGHAVGGFAIDALTPAVYPMPLPFPAESDVDSIIKALAKRVRVRGDANYCICRIVLESMKPAGGWGYHSLSATLMALDTAFNLVYDIQREQKLHDSDVAGAISVISDVATEIERRLIGPYEDKAILKNGDMACFDEDFAYKPIGLDMSKWRNDLPTCGCQCKPDSEEEPSDIVDSGPILDAFDLKTMGGLPPITDVFTREQIDAIDKERKSNE
jgi:hypothetical protein